MKPSHPPALNRRQFVLGASSVLALSTLPFSKQAWSSSLAIAKSTPTLSGNYFELQIGYQAVNFTGVARTATTVNGGLPGPTLRWKEGERVTLRVTNNLKHESSIHWHGIILPSTMDGSPGFDFAGIKPGETFEYAFDVKQSGTYWYHSHSGFQEQTGLLGSIIIDPKEPDPIHYDRDMVIQLSDWSDETPEQIYAKLKKKSHYYNFRERTLSDTLQDIKTKGILKTWQDRSMWNHMRMSDRDIADVTGHTYTYLMNGITPDQGWLGLCKAGEKVRLRFINGAAMSIFDVRIPGLKMTVVAADGQNIQPVVVDEFRIAAAETYDVIVEPQANHAYTLFAQSIDRTGYARGTLTTDINLKADIPSLDVAPILSHQDMGMGSSDHSSHDKSQIPASAIGTDNTDHSMHGMDHSMHDMDHTMHDMSDAVKSTAQTASTFVKAGLGNSSKRRITHAGSEVGAQIDMRSISPRNGLSDPGIGLRNHQHLYNRKVLTYADLRSLHPTRDTREPTREIELHITGNMHRYMWSFDGISFMDAPPFSLNTMSACALYLSTTQ